MKVFYLVLSVVFTVLILILAFGNFGAQCSGLHFLFFPVQQNPTIVIFGVAILGIITGIFYHGFLTKVFEAGEEEEDF